MVTLNLLQAIFLGFNFAASGFTLYMSYKISRINEVPTGIWQWWTAFFLLRFISYAASVFFLVQLNQSRSIFGNYVTVAGWVYGAIVSIIALVAVAKTYKSLLLKYPWTR